MEKAKLNLQPETEREFFLSFNNEIKNLRETIERFGQSLINLENTKFNNHELRLNILEKIESERKGMWKFILICGTIMGLLLSILTIKTFIKP